MRASARRNRPSVPCGRRSQNPVASAGWLAASYHQRRSREQRQLWEPLATFLAAHELTPRSQELFARLRHLFRVPAILREAITTLPADWPSALLTDTDPTVGGIVRHILQYNNAIGDMDGREAMGDQDRAPVFSQVSKLAKYRLFRGGI